MKLIQLLLPRTVEGRDLMAEVRTTRAELVDRFGGITLYERSPASGAWVNTEGDIERDVMVMVEVITDEFDRGWWRQDRLQLAERFSQNEIHIRSLAIEVP